MSFVSTQAIAQTYNKYRSKTAGVPIPVNTLISKPATLKILWLSEDFHPSLKVHLWHVVMLVA